MRLVVVLLLLVFGASAVCATAGKTRNIQAKIISVKFCSPERESVCVNTSKGDMGLNSPYSGMIDGSSFKELFYLLHLNQDAEVILVVENDSDIIGIKTQHYSFIAPEIVGNKLKTRNIP